MGEQRVSSSWDGQRGHHHPPPWRPHPSQLCLAKQLELGGGFAGASLGRYVSTSLSIGRPLGSLLRRVGGRLLPQRTLGLAAATPVGLTT